jgi:hypothetical protein
MVIKIILPKKLKDRWKIEKRIIKSNKLYNLIKRETNTNIADKTNFKAEKTR